MTQDQIKKNFEAMVAIDSIAEATQHILDTEAPSYMTKSQKNVLEYWRDQAVAMMYRQIEEIVASAREYGSKKKDKGKKGAD